MSKIRTIKEAINELKRSDANSALTEYALRKMIKCGTVPYISTGTGKTSKILVNVDILEKVLNGSSSEK